MRRILPLAAIIFLLVIGAAQAEEKKSDADSIREAAQNPISSMINLPFQNNTAFDVGPDDGYTNILNIQPVYPVQITDSWNLINRAILPISHLSSDVPGGARTGFGDLNYSAFFSPITKSKLTWGVGPVITVPTSSDDLLGTGKFSAGPTAVALYISKPWVAGMLLSQQWSFAGEGGREDVDFFLAQPFVNYNMDKGWYLVSSPIITANWNASSGNKWTVPVGGGFGRLFHWGKQPINTSVQAFKNVESTTGSGDWSTRFQMQFMFPKS